MGTGAGQKGKRRLFRRRHDEIVSYYHQLLANPNTTAVFRVKWMNSKFGPGWAIYFHPERTPEIADILSRRNHSRPGL